MMVRSNACSLDVPGGIHSRAITEDTEPEPMWRTSVILGVAHTLWIDSYDVIKRYALCSQKRVFDALHSLDFC